MKPSRTRVMLYMLLIIGVLSLILALLSSPSYMAYITGMKEGLSDEIKPAMDIAPLESDILPKTYTVEMIQVKEAALPTLPSVSEEKTDVYNPETVYYINTVSANRPKMVNKSAIFKVDAPTTVALYMETVKTESFIAIAPQEGGRFPTKFEFTLTNDIEKNKLSLDLWGASPTAENVPSNSIIGSDNYAVYPYPKDTFQTKDKEGKLVDGLLLGGLNIGNNAFNIINSGRLFNRQFTDVGEVKNLDNKISITCNNSAGITGILLYLGKATTTKIGS